MENKVNELTLLIDMPSCGDPALPTTSLNNVADQFKIVEVEILYKESDSAAVMVVDTVRLQYNPGFKGVSNVLRYTYSGTKPFRTLPEDQLTRVYDKIPVKALGQEIISNRVVYSNFQTKHTPPESLNYNVGTQPKQQFNVVTPEDNPIEWRTSIVEYPNHTLKQNRNYQAGFVLSDRFGRTTSTLLSNAGESVGGVARLSTVYSPYNEGNGVVDIGSWPGDALFVQVNETINETPVASSMYPGTYVGDPTLGNYNPLGFETWKVVVKQQEQDYYNVYLPGILAAYPEDETKEIGLTSHVVLFNDNINKVPRDLAEVGPDQKQFRSSVQLFGRVQNTTFSGINVNNIGLVNKQYYPSRFSDTVSTIQDEFGLFNIDSASPGNEIPGAFYEADSNPLIGRISTTNKIGQTNPLIPDPASGYSIFNLAVYETEPVESKLDIYWETSTSGTIEDLNAQVELTGGQTIFQIQNFDWYISEYFGVYSGPATWDPAVQGSPEPGNALAQGPTAIPNNGYSGRFRSVISGEDQAAGSENGAFYFEEFNGTPIQSVTLVNFIVTDGLGDDVTNQFDILKIDGTANGGPGRYTNYKGQDSLVTGYTHDSFIMVNKRHRVFLGAEATEGTVNGFEVTIVVSDDSLAPDAPPKTFGFPNGSLNDVKLTDLQTIHVGGEQLIGNSVSWGQNSQPILDFVLPQPNIPNQSAGLFFEYGYEEGLSNTDLVKFYGMNGANKNNNGGIGVALPNQETLQWSIGFQQQPFGTDLADPIFEINPNTGVLKEITPGQGFGLYGLQIKLDSDDPSEIADFNIKITIGRKTTDGSFSNNLRGNTALELSYDNAYVFNLHNTTSTQGNFGAYDQIPDGSSGDPENRFRKAYPNIGNIYSQQGAGDDLNAFYRNDANGSYAYGPQNAGFQRLNLLQPSGSSNLEGALTQGTGYINIEMFLETVNMDTQYQTSQVSWAVEYRKVINGVVQDWEAATDIEGNVLSWNQDLDDTDNDPLINPQQSGQKIDGTGGGSLSPANTSNATHRAANANESQYPEQKQVYGAGSVENTGTVNDNPANTVQYKAERPTSVNATKPYALIGKWVVVGESPIYGQPPYNVPSCLGEYRIIIQNIGGECEDCQSMIAASNTGRNPDYSDAGFMNIGDFYYDLKPLNAPRAYGYYVDLSTFEDSAQGLEDALDNNMFPISQNPSVQILYAEEGVNRYVSQFYADPGLTVVVTNTSNGYQWSGGTGGDRYVSYTSVETGDSNYNVPYGINVPSGNPIDPEEARTPNLAAENAASLDRTDQYKRLWACKINTSTGLKEVMTSVGRAQPTP
jgi:hypothetical protein